MNQLDQAKQDYASTTAQTAFDRAIAQKVLELPRPSMSAKLNKVAELFELDVLSEEEALKACKVIIGQHARAKTKEGSTEEGIKVIK